MFHGKECPHCKKVHPLVDRLEQEEGIEVLRLEIWHNTENADLMRKYAPAISPACGGSLGVPCFYNKSNGEALCGSKLTYEQIKGWAKKG